MDIMDSSDTPTGGLDGSTASSSAALPLSVDERDDFASPTNSSRVGGTQATSTLSSDSGLSASSPTGSNGIDDSLPNALPTSMDDVMMPMQEHTSHPSVLSQDTTSSFPSTSSSSPSATSSASAKASAAMADAKASAQNVAADAKEKASAAADSAKSGASSAMSTLQSKLHAAEDKAESAYDNLKHDVKAHLPQQTSAKVNPTDTHPMAASMHDAHLHPGMVSVATHENEIHPTSNSTTPHVSTAHQRGLDAAAASQHEPKDASAGGVMGALEQLHQKLEDGVEVVKDRVDGWAERNMRSSPKEGDHLSEAHAKDLPTLVDTSNERNIANIRLKMHSSGERAGAQSLQQDNSV